MNGGQSAGFSVPLSSSASRRRRTACLPSPPTPTPCPCPATPPPLGFPSHPQPRTPGRSGQGAAQWTAQLCLWSQCRAAASPLPPHLPTPRPLPLLPRLSTAIRLTHADPPALFVLLSPTPVASRATMRSRASWAAASTARSLRASTFAPTRRLSSRFSRLGGGGFALTMVLTLR